MLTTAEIQRVLDRLTYRPGWSFEVRDAMFEGPRFRLLALGVMDSTDPSRTIDLGIDDFLPPMRDEEAVIDWLAWRLGRIESHESREWLRCDGKVVYDPHAPKPAEANQATNGCS